MPELGCVLLADDEETFLQSTADILRREGYECDCAHDGHAAAELLTSGRYELLVADIKMPGNPELELVRGIEHVSPGLPVILVTGYPSVPTATASISLPVVAYMVKPVDMDQLLRHMGQAIARYRAYRRVCESRDRLEGLHRELTHLEAHMRQPAAPGAVSTQEFLDLTTTHIIQSLNDIRALTRPVSPDELHATACHLLGCPQLAALTSVLEDAIQVLRETKGSFKSKSLGELRKRLEAVVGESRAQRDGTEAEEAE